MALRDVDQWLADLRTHRDQLRAELRRVDALLAAARQVEAETGGPRRASSDTMLGRITRLFEANPEEEFDADAIWRRLQDEGMDNAARDPVNSIRGALSRLKKRGLITDVRRGVFKLQVPVERSDGGVSGRVDDEDDQHDRRGPTTRESDPWSTRPDPWATQAGSSDEPPF